MDISNREQSRKRSKMATQKKRNNICCKKTDFIVLSSG